MDANSFFQQFFGARFAMRQPDGTVYISWSCPDRIVACGNDIVHDDDSSEECVLRDTMTPSEKIDEIKSAMIRAEKWE